MGKEKKPKILIVNCYSDNNKVIKGNRYTAPQQMTTITLAGVLHPLKTDIKNHCEFLSGSFDQFKLFEWAEMVVLTGLNTAFDRMKQISAYAKTINPNIITVMGGSVARAIPKLSAQYFDIVATGDVEELIDIVNQSFEGDFAAEVAIPRYDLAKWMFLIRYAESSRNCNFKCNFCSMAAEKNKHFVYDSSTLRNQIRHLGTPPAVMFMDQNFYAGSRKNFLDRIAILKELHDCGKLKTWSGLVTSDFYRKEDNMRLVKEAGCSGFFSGVESFSPEQIASYKKKQNLILPQDKIIMSSLNAGLVFHYGLMLDTTERPLQDLRDELDYVLHNSRITLPSFLSLPIPLLGTPLFHQTIKKNEFLPNVKLRDMDGRSLMCKPLDSIEDATAFVKELEYGYMKRSTLFKRQWQFFWRYRKKLSKIGMGSALTTLESMGYPKRGTNGREDTLFNKNPRTHLASTEKLGNLYQPSIRIDAKYQHHFSPLMVTDEQGQLHPDLEADMSISFKAEDLTKKAV